MIERFNDAEHGRRRLVDALERQQIVGKNNALAIEFANACELFEIKPGEKLISQDGNDSDFYLILIGSFSILINLREIAVRSAGAHVGEMAMIDPTVKRSADVVAKELSVVARITEGKFSEIANRFPITWRCIAVELSQRLRERSKFVRPPNEKPMIFIGCSSENLEIAKIVKEQIRNDFVEVRIWSEPGIFKLSKSALESLIGLAKAFDFAVMIFDENDVIESRNETYLAPRDNVVFELGLFIGSIGAERSFILRSKSHDLKVPSDLLGITALAWDSKNRDASLVAQCVQINEVIKDLGSK